jgi:ribosomal protein S21
MINAEVTKTGNENSVSLLRKFSRRVQGTGLMRRMKSKRYRTRPLSSAVKKKKALRRIKKSATVKQLIKEGKMSETPNRNGRNNKKK